jgi:hypothetical protein
VFLLRWQEAEHREGLFLEINHIARKLDLPSEFGIRLFQAGNLALLGVVQGLSARCLGLECCQTLLLPLAPPAPEL